MGLWDNGINLVLPGFFAAVGAALAAPIVLPALARVARPTAKAVISLYFDITDDIQEVLAHHQPRPARSGGLVHGLLQGQAEDLVAQELGLATEETLTGTILEELLMIL